MPSFPLRCTRTTFFDSQQPAKSDRLGCPRIWKYIDVVLMTKARPMKTVPFFVATALLAIGCIHGSVALRNVSETALPGTAFSVLLTAPSSHGGSYFYSLWYRAPSGRDDLWNQRYLGTSSIDETVAPNVLVLSPGVFRITWGQGSQSAYAVIDVGKRVIIEDSNPENPPNEAIHSRY